MVNQLIAIDFFSKVSPTHIAQFIFDYSIAHACKAKEAVVGNRVSLRSAEWGWS